MSALVEAYLELLKRYWTKEGSHVFSTGWSRNQAAATFPNPVNLIQHVISQAAAANASFIPTTASMGITISVTASRDNPSCH